jgi:hypothetical protein
MKKGDRRPERRKTKRYQVQDGVFVILRPSDTGACRVINVSMAGLMFEYVTMKEPTTQPTELEIFVTDSLFRLHEVPCHSVWDLPIYKNLAIPVHKRRSGVQFGELTESQTSQLEHFIEEYTTREV